MKQYRFFYHYFKAKKKMSVHFKGKCYITDNVICNVPCETKWRASQPYLVMQGFAKYIDIKNDSIAIE